MRDPFLVVVLIVAAALRLYGIDHGLPYVYNPDEVNIMARALSIARGLDPAYYLYPSLFFYFLFAIMGALFALGWAVGSYASAGAFQAQFFTDPTVFYLAGRLVGVMSALGTIVVTYLVVRKHFGQAAARASALLIAVAFVGVRDAHYLKHDVPSGLLFVLVIWASDRAFERCDRRSYLIAGVFIGVGFATHYYMIFLAPAFVMGHWAFRRFDDFRHVLLTGAVSAATFFVLSPFVVLHFPTALEHMRANRQVVVDRSFDSGTSLFPSLGLYLEFLWSQGIGVVFFALVLAGIAILAYRSPRQLTLWGTFPVLFFGFITYTFFAGRYLNPILPAMAAACGVAVSVIVTRFGSTVAAAVVAIACVQPVYSALQIDRLFAGHDTRTLAREWMVANAEAGDVVALQSYSVPLPQSATSFRDSLAARGATSELDRGGKYASLLAVAELEDTAFELVFLGRGDELNRIYMPYEELASGLEPLRARGARYVILRHAPRPPPAAVSALFERVRAEGQLVHTVSPFADGQSGTPYIDNEDWAATARLAHKGPLVEIWRIEP